MRTRSAFAAWVAAVGLAGGASVAAAERPWIELASPHFVVVSNAGEKEASRTAWQFEQVRSVFRNLWPWARTRPGRRFVVMAVRDEATLKALAPAYWERRGGVRPAGVFVAGMDRDFVAMRTDVAEPDDVGVNPYSMAYAGYAHIVLDASFPGTLPLWYQRGLAELFGNTVVRSKDVHVGRLIPWHMRTLAERARLPLRELLAADRGSPHYTDDSRREIYDAQAWILVHYLVFGENRANLPRFNRYSELLRAGGEPTRAFAEAFGDPAVLERGLGSYLSRRLYGYVQFKADVNVKPEAFPARTLSPAEAAAARAAFHAAMRRPEEARALTAQARQAAPDLAATYEVEGLLLDAEDKEAEAAKAFARAAELGSDSFYVHYRVAQLLWTPNPDPAVRARVVASLEKAVALHADSAEATAFLANVLAETAPAEALRLARRAVELEPSSARHRLTLARVLAGAGSRDEAVREAERASTTAREPGDRKHAQELLAWLRQQQAAAPAADIVRRCQDDGDQEACASYAEAARQACDTGDPGACSALAYLHDEGKGVARDASRAMALYDKACAADFWAACLRRAMAHARQGDVAEARKLLDKACRGGEQQACTWLASLPKPK